MGCVSGFPINNVVVGAVLDGCGIEVRTVMPSSVEVPPPPPPPRSWVGCNSPHQRSSLLKDAVNEGVGSVVKAVVVTGIIVGISGRLRGQPLCSIVLPPKRLLLDVKALHGTVESCGSALVLFG